MKKHIKNSRFDCAKHIQDHFCMINEEIKLKQKKLSEALKYSANYSYMIEPLKYNFGQSTILILKSEIDKLQQEQTMLESIYGYYYSEEMYETYNNLDIYQTVNH